jgi:4a-hydroxytetrahydrobiopterin dehydratase
MISRPFVIERRSCGRPTREDGAERAACLTSPIRASNVLPMTDLLTDDQITSSLRDLPGWQARPGCLVRDVTAPDFLSGIALVADVAQAAEQMNHHPDIDIRWTTVTFSLTTHAQGGVTNNDVELARRISEIVDQRVGE